MRFFVGLHQPYDLDNMPDGQGGFISVNRLRRYRNPFIPDNDWIMDSGAFTEVSTYGGYRHSAKEYADDINRICRHGCLAAVAQDYMCEPFILRKTGLTIADHQRLTIERYDEVIDNVSIDLYVLPVLQGYSPESYVDHIRAYGDRLNDCQWVGVGSVCKRNKHPREIIEVLSAIKKERADLRLHGFGVKLTSLAVKDIRDLFYSADSMAWSFDARYGGRNANDWREAASFCQRINRLEFERNYEWEPLFS